MLENNIANLKGEPDYSVRITLSYMIGVYLAVNAIKDAFILIDGPDCTHMKTQFIQGNHDWLSTLVSVSGFHRVANTSLHPAQMALSREDSIRENLLNMANHEFVKGLLISSMPMASLTGIDYERITRSVAKETNKDVVHVPGKSLSGCWLSGYKETLLSIAKQIEFKKGNILKENVAIIGNLFDRNEGDNEGNIIEIKRLLNEMGLNVVSIWLSGENFATLKEVAHASTIISLPYGREAAKVLAKRLNVNLVETVLPFGLLSTEKFLRDIGEALKIKNKTESVIEKELKLIMPKIEWVTQFIFQNLVFGYIGDSHLLCGFVEISELLGCTVDFAVISNKNSHLKEFLATHRDKVKYLPVDPKRKTLQYNIQERAKNNLIHFMVANNEGFQFGNIPMMEFGFPSYFYHILHREPFLGFNGFLAFIDRMANHIRYNEYLRTELMRGVPYRRKKTSKQREVSKAP